MTRISPRGKKHEESSWLASGLPSIPAASSPIALSLPFPRARRSPKLPGCRPQTEEQTVQSSTPAPRATDQVSSGHLACGGRSQNPAEGLHHFKDTGKSCDYRLPGRLTRTRYLALAIIQTCCPLLAPRSFCRYCIGVSLVCPPLPTWTFPISYHIQNLHGSRHPQIHGHRDLCVSPHGQCVQSPVPASPCRSTSNLPAVFKHRH